MFGCIRILIIKISKHSLIFDVLPTHANVKEIMVSSYTKIFPVSGLTREVRKRFFSSFFIRSWENPIDV